VTSNNAQSALIKQFIDTPSNNGFRAIHFASYRGNIEVLNLLIQNGADIHCVNNRGLNVIHMAAQGDQPGSLIFFKEKYNLDIEIRDSLLNTPLHWACYMGSELFFSFILSYTNEKDDYNRNVINLDAQDSQGLTPLHLAVISEKSKLIKKLIHQGADRYIRDKKNRTPFHLAIEKNKQSIAEMLEEPQSCFLNFNYVIRSNLEKTQRSKANMLVFIFLHFLICSGVFFLILPHFKFFSFSIFYISMLMIVMMLFFILNLSDPGFQGYNLLKYLDNDNNITPRKLLLGLLHKNINIDDYCPYCIVQKNEANKIKHCYFCNRCIKDYDHHCYWVDNCIGANNINLFFIFLTFVLLNLLLQVYIGLYGLLMKRVSDNYLANDKAFPPTIDFFVKIHLYEKTVKTVLCSLLLIICIAFILPVGYLWFKNLKYLFLRIKKAKRKENKKFENSILEKVDENENNIILEGEDRQLIIIKN
jgi:palmitoyltransferase ZDHHC13/17